MKHYEVILMLAAALGASTTIQAKKVAVPKMYVFGIAASFNDTIVHFTDIQEVDSAWIDKKTKFLAGRDTYSYQLRDYLEQKQQMPHRTCIVFYNKKRAKLEKKFLKMKRLYLPGKDGKVHFDVRYLNKSDFMFEAYDASDDEQ